MAGFTDAEKNTLLTQTGEDLSGGTLVLQTEGEVEVATLGLSSDSGNALNTPSSGQATFKAMTQDDAATGGITSQFKMKNSGSTDLISGTVTATGGGGDLTLSTTTIAASGVVDDNTITISL
ncbi:MAG: hypothetical protein GY853_09875 [PVC group bacterium]|nr:hypothetical protein [PVC group bacterium]